MNNTWTPADPAHFLFLRTISGELYVAIEDLPFEHSDKDYDDAIYEVVHAPEPGSFLLLGTGLAALVRMSKRRRVPA